MADAATAENVFRREIGDRLRVLRTPPGSGARFDQQLFIQKDEANKRSCRQRGSYALTEGIGEGNYGVGRTKSSLQEIDPGDAASDKKSRAFGMRETGQSPGDVRPPRRHPRPTVASRADSCPRRALMASLNA
jgi:hypothetical protein